MKITVRTSARVHIYTADVVVPVDGFLLSADVDTQKKIKKLFI
jgi:hypothetical protein